MFTTKDLEVYKDTLKEKKNKATKEVVRPLKISPSIARTAKPPPSPGRNNEEPMKERRPLSVVHKAANTNKDQHKPLSPTLVGTSKQPDPSVRIKYTIPKSPKSGRIHGSEDAHLVKTLELRSDSLRSPKEVSSVKPFELKIDDKAGRKLKEPSTLFSNGVHQKNSAIAGTKGSPVAGVTASLCSECTRAASEGAVCFIGNDGRVSACTTRSAVRLCKNLNCAANNPDYVAAMANAPKKYLISKRHLLKAQFGPKTRSGQPKLPNLERIEVELSPQIDGLSSSNDVLSPSNDDMSYLNGDLSPINGDLHPIDGDLSLVDGDLSPFNEDMGSTNGDLGLSNDDSSILDSLTDENGREQGSAGLDFGAEQNGFDEHMEFSFHEGVVENGSPKLLINESSKAPIDAHLDDDGFFDANLHIDDGSSQFNIPRELHDEETYGSSMDKASHLEVQATQNNANIISPTKSTHQEDDVQSGDEIDDVINDTSTAGDSLFESSEGMESTPISRGNEDPASVSNSNNSLNKGYQQRRRRSMAVVEDPNPETVTLRKQQMQGRKQAEEWMLNHAIEGVVHKLAPTGERKVKVLVEAFESIISHTGVEGIDPHNGEATPFSNQEKHTLAFAL